MAAMEKMNPALPDTNRLLLHRQLSDYWTMTESRNIDLDADDYVLNRARLYRHPSDFGIHQGDSGHV